MNVDQTFTCDFMNRPFTCDFMKFVLPCWPDACVINTESDLRFCGLSFL